MSTTLSTRAREAAIHLRRAAETDDPADRRKATERARAQIRIAALLGLPLTAVTVTPDNRRASNPFDCLILTATDPAAVAAYRFHLADPRYDDTPLYLLRPCPVCTGPVPFQEVSTLADLAGAHRPLDFPTDGSLPEALRTSFGAPAFLDDPGHHATCVYGAGTTP